ncbi:MAG: hypothetical protein AB7E55_36660, partial [Pigmentiphaga sp.]
AALIDRIPKDVPNDRSEETAKLNHVIVEIRATDLDNADSGWQGRIEGITGRIKIEFGEGVDLEEAATKRKFNADVILTSVYRGGDTNPRPNSMLIEKIY